MSHYTHNQQGFTLIELVIVIALSSIIFVVSMKMLAEGFNAYLAGKRIASADQQTRLAVQRLTRDIRMIRPSNDIATATTTQLSFIDTTGATVSYTLSGTNLQRNSVTLAGGINALTFSYFDQNGNVTATPASIRYVEFNLNIIQGGANFSVSNTVFLDSLS